MALCFFPHSLPEAQERLDYEAEYYIGRALAGC